MKRNRKPVFSIDECCVCAEALDAMIGDISFCAKCGQNVHEVCMEAWKRSSTTSSKKELIPTCPMCRASWENESLLNQLDIESELDAEATQIYLDWLYTSTLHISAKVSRVTDAFNLVILKLWTVANAVEDPVFKSQVIATYFAEARARFWKESVKWAFVDRKCDEEIRAFVIDISLAYIEPGWFKSEGKNWPEAFVSELADAAMVRWGDRKDGRTTRKMWMEKLSVGVDLTSDDEDTAPVGGSTSLASAASRSLRGRNPAIGLNSPKAEATEVPATRKRPCQKVEVKKHTHSAKRRLKQDVRSMPLSDDSDDGGLVVYRSKG
ncbi:uncharacterized protein J4E84_000377 [Alternaria hordeiaustralica]|nr:uncharacterized protein J4E84_000377 [Alternaria hordeiaustralica]KAI4697250.1 hypothetical protein J4E84_000377 [Alternaria hordeiaustralica]